LDSKIPKSGDKDRWVIKKSVGNRINDVESIEGTEAWE